MNIILTNSEKNDIKNNLKNLTYDKNGNIAYITQLRRLGYNCLPDRLLNILENQKSSLDPLPYIIIENLPTDDAVYGSPQFPQTGRGLKSGDISENILCMIGALLGEPYSIFFEGNELVNNLTPSPSTSNDYSGLGSAVELDLHIENAALKFLNNQNYSPLGIILTGVRQQLGNQIPYTNVVDGIAAIAKLSKQDIETLKGNNYMIKLPYRWRDAMNNGQEFTICCPIISGASKTTEVNVAFYSDMVQPTSEVAKKALDNFYLALKNLIVKINITPGKIVYIDNRIALHSRDKFTALYDKSGHAYRWVQRLFIMPNLWSLQNFSKVGDRLFNPR